MAFTGPAAGTRSKAVALTQHQVHCLCIGENHEESCITLKNANSKSRRKDRKDPPTQDLNVEQPESQTSPQNLVESLFSSHPSTNHSEDEYDDDEDDEDYVPTEENNIVNGSDLPDPPPAKVRHLQNYRDSKREECRSKTELKRPEIATDAEINDPLRSLFQQTWDFTEGAIENLQIGQVVQEHSLIRMEDCLINLVDHASSSNSNINSCRNEIKDVREHCTQWATGIKEYVGQTTGAALQKADSAMQKATQCETKFDQATNLFKVEMTKHKAECSQLAHAVADMRKEGGCRPNSGLNSTPTLKINAN
ncbi:unnamed protein product, partial [Allacma fusca]